MGETGNINAKNEILQLLSRAWILYVEHLAGRNYERVLQAIQEAQLAVFDE